jgi:ribonuclease G
MKVRRKSEAINLVKLIVNYSTTEKRYAVVENKMMTKIYVDQPLQQSLVGNIYIGIVTKVVPGINAAFIDIGEEKQGFLHRDKLVNFVLSPDSIETKEQKPISQFVHQGERILVQIEKDSTGIKGPRLSGILEFQGENIIYQPHGGFVATSQKIDNQRLRDELKEFGERLIDHHEGIIFRTNSEKASQDEIESELYLLRKEFEQLQKEAIETKGPQLLKAKDLFLNQLFEELNAILAGEIIVDDLKLKQRFEAVLLQKRKSDQIKLQLYQGKENVFSSMTLELEVEKALKRLVWLDNGSYIVIDEMEALTIIDVNTGKFVGKSNRQMTVNQVNKVAAVEVAKQVILRDLGGMILIDFIDMKLESERQDIIRVLSAELKKDSKKPKIIGFTELGILQLTRRKTKPSLSETMLVKCPTCDGTGRISSPESVAFRLERELWEYRNSDYEAIYVETTEEVYQLFSGGNSIHHERLEDSIGLKILFTCELSPKPYYKIIKLSNINE